METKSINHVSARITEQVQAWRQTRRAWLRATEERAQLDDAWVDCSTRYGADSPPACGCLLALVREAWGPNYEIRVSIEADGVAVSLYWSALVAERSGEFIYEFLREPHDIAGALAAALMAAPRQQETATP